MINEEQENYVKQFISQNDFNVQKIISYLNLHDIVGAEIFQIAEKDENLRGNMLSEGYGYTPVKTEVFIRRIPLYFYRPDYEKGDYGSLIRIMNSFIDTDCYDINDNEILESIYLSLEKMLYRYEMSVREIMNYAHIISKTAYKGEFFFRWINYLEQCEKLHINNKYPKAFLFETNRIKELSGEIPDIFEPGLVGFNEDFIRNGNEIVVGGEFPCDENNQPALQWIGVWIENSAYVKVDQSYGLDKPNKIKKELRIGLTPNTKIYIPYPDNNGIETWIPIYFGPLVMEFDNSTLKKYRERAKLTQREVAEAVGIQIRTYQKWEGGEVKPDGYNLIRLMNYLDINSVQDFLSNTPIIDPEYKKFRNRKNYGLILD